ncbi:hypothetical protein V6N13_095415 [Hibiscus sabdariffa]
MVVSGFIYDVIVEPPGIGSTQDPATGAVRPVVFLSGRVNGQYIIEGLSSGFMFVLGGIGLCCWILPLIKTGLGVSRFPTQSRDLLHCHCLCDDYALYPHQDSWLS